VVRVTKVTVPIVCVFVAVSYPGMSANHPVRSEKKTADNSVCDVCHAGLIEEEISRVHLAEGISCADCHGASTEHMDDEMLMTKPDFLFGRKEIDSMCTECHSKDHKQPAVVEAFCRERLGEIRENGRAITESSVCTDCHGTHNMVTTPAGAEKERDEAKWTTLFNGKDLAGWTVRGDALWSVERGCIVGRQGPDGAAGDLFTETEYGDFDLVVTFKMQWPGNSGVWFRYRAQDKTYQADILEYTDPVCYSGTLYCPGKRFIAMNKDSTIVNRDLWNTIEVRARGDHLVVALNDVVTADVHDSSFDRGRIGFQVHGGDAYNNMQISVREVLIRPLGP